jgi:hypothetical protein
VHQRELREEPRGQVYLPDTTNQNADRHLSRMLLIKSSNPTVLLESLRPVMYAAVPGLPYASVSLFSDLARAKRVRGSSARPCSRSSAHWHCSSARSACTRR